MKREDLLVEVYKMLGHEDALAIWFAELVDKASDEVVKEGFKFLKILMEDENFDFDTVNGL